jgi:hypothetical protein
MKRLLVVLILVLNLEADGYKSLLFSGNCATCHLSNKSESAPSVVEIKERYKSAFQNKKDFVDYMSTWVQYPNKDTSLMVDSIKKYELMPELGFDLETLREISEYIYDTDFQTLQTDPKVR